LKEQQQQGRQNGLHGFSKSKLLMFMAWATTVWLGVGLLLAGELWLKQFLRQQ
jgi:hypothetical protein